MMFFIQCDSPALWQTYLHDPASITMEGILIFNKHLLFLLTVIVLFVAITGTQRSLPLFDSMELLGRSIIRDRLSQAIAMLSVECDKRNL